jgi:antitoxin component YwqK of YwqJK toxin-antitoxin module
MKTLLFILTLLTTQMAWGSDTLSCNGTLDKDGKKHGVWLCKNNSGQLLKKERYKHGELSTWMLFNNKGQMVQSRNRKGKIRKYNPCGC